MRPHAAMRIERESRIPVVQDVKRPEHRLPNRLAREGPRRTATHHRCGTDPRAAAPSPSRSIVLPATMKNV